MMSNKLLGGVLAVLVALAAGAAWADGDPDKGKKVFKKCKACHTLNEGGAHKVDRISTAYSGVRRAPSKASNIRMRSRKPLSSGMTIPSTSGWPIRANSLRRTRWRSPA